MGIKNTASKYGFLAKFFHWTMFLFLLAAVIAGYNIGAMEDSPEKRAEAVNHTSFGLVILTMVLLRLFWKLRNINPERLDDISPARHKLARRVHGLLYVLMFLQPLSGIGMVQAYDAPLTFFGMFSVPALIPASESLGVFFYFVHATVWMLLSALVIGHAVVALHHHFVQKNNTLRRMTFGLKRDNGE